MKIFSYDKEVSSITSKDKYNNKNQIVFQKHKTFDVFFMYQIESEMFDRIKHNKYINLTTKRLAVKQKFVNCKPTL